MGHGPAVKLGVDKASGYKAKLGVYLFVPYTLAYVIFVGISVLQPSLMESAFMGQTLAVAYGMGLIVFAFVLAIIYNRFCSRAEQQMNNS
jgi:uncharacterized membrane protein (DUF485 family)